MSDVKIERREFFKKAAYAVPVILTLKAMPAFAAAGSQKNGATRERGRNFFSGNQSDQVGSGRSNRR